MGSSTTSRAGEGALLSLRVGGTSAEHLDHREARSLLQEPRERLGIRVVLSDEHREAFGRWVVVALETSISRVGGSQAENGGAQRTRAVKLAERAFELRARRDVEAELRRHVAREDGHPNPARAA